MTEALKDTHVNKMKSGGEMEVPRSKSKSKAYRRGCIFYFFLYMSYGSIVPYLPLIWRDKGFSESQVGLLGSIRPAMSFLATPVLCGFADRRNIQQQILYVAMMLYAVFPPSVLVAGGFSAVVVVETLSSIAKSPITSLVDAAVRHSFGGDGYGVQRLWGAFGFGVASFISGYLCDAAGGGYEGVMLFFVAVMAIGLMASTGVPVGRNDDLPDVDEDKDCECPMMEDDGAVALKTEPKSVKRVNHDGASNGILVDGIVIPTAANGGVANQMEDNVTSGTSKRFRQEPLTIDDRKTHDDAKGRFLTVVRLMFGTLESSSLFAAVLLSGMAGGVIDIFLFIRLKELGGSHMLIGLTRLAMCLSEVPCFYLSGPLIKRVGVRGAISLAQVAYLTRLIYYSNLKEPWWVLPAEMVHGMTFAITWSATTDYAHQIAPAHMRTTVQGVISGLHWGLGFGLGALLGGILYEHLGARLCFIVSSILPLFALMLLASPTARLWFSSTMTNSQRHWMVDSEYELAQTENNEIGIEAFYGGDVKRDLQIDGNGYVSNGKNHELIL
eukprot:jgi/Undpi1/12094/HiC_scaffold_4.g01792.m1